MTEKEQLVYISIMLTKHLPALLCAGSLALASTEKPSDILLRIAQSDLPKVQSTVEQRAARFPALGGIPSNAGIVTSVSDIREIARAIMNSDLVINLMLMDNTEEDFNEMHNEIMHTIDNQLFPITGIAFGTTTRSYQQWMKFFEIVHEQSMTTNMLFNWSLMASDEYKENLAKLAKSYILEQATQMAITEDMDPIYLNISFPEDATGEQYVRMTKLFFNEMLRSMLYGAEEEYSFEERDDMDILRIDTRRAIINEMDSGSVWLETYYDYEHQNNVEVMMDKLHLAPKYLYLVCKKVGSDVRLALCADLDKLSFPEKPEESMLASKNLDFANATLDKNAYFLHWNTAEVSKATNLLSNAKTFTAVAQFALTQLAEAKGNEKSAKIAAAAKSIGVLTPQMLGLLPDFDSEVSLVAWADGDLHWDCRTGFSPIYADGGKINQFSFADDENTILYAEISRLRSPSWTLSGKELVEHVFTIAEGTSLTFNESIAKEFLQPLAMALTFKDEAILFSEGLGKALKGLSSASGIVMDNAGTCPAFASVNPEMQMPVPRLAIFADVLDRKILAEGWEDMLTATDSLMKKTSPDVDVRALLPFKSTQQGNAVSYALPYPIFTKEFLPSVTITDSKWVIGSHPSLNTLIANNTPSNTPVTGAVAMLRLAPLVPIVQSLADVYKYEGEHPEAVLLPPIVPSEDGEYYEGDDYELPEPVIEVPDEAAMMAYELSESFDMLKNAVEAIAPVMDGIYVTESQKNGVYRCRATVKFNKIKTIDE